MTGVPVVRALQTHPLMSADRLSGPLTPSGFVFLHSNSASTTKHGLGRGALPFWAHPALQLPISEILAIL